MRRTSITELEANRHEPTTLRGECWLPHDHRPLSDYALRASRALGFLAATDTAPLLLTTDRGLGLPDAQPSRRPRAPGHREIEDGEPKSDAGDDTIPLDSGTVTVLEAHHRRQDEARAEWGQAWQESGKVFTREDGSALHPDHVTDAFARLAYGAGLPPIRLHDLRHGAATLMLAGGADMKLVQALLRHSSLAITADTYTSVLPEVAREAAQAAAALVPRKIPAEEAGPYVLPTSSQDEEE